MTSLLLTTLLNISLAFLASFLGIPHLPHVSHYFYLLLYVLYCLLTYTWTNVQRSVRHHRKCTCPLFFQRSHSSNVVVALQSRLASMTSSFKEVLEVRTENLRDARSRQEMFSQVCAESV